MLSNTVIVCVQVAELPHASVALYVRVTVKRFVQVMLLVTSFTNVTVAPPPQLSEAETEAGLLGGIELAQATDVAPGHEILGGVLSNTVMVWLHVAEFPQASVAV